MEQQDCMPSCHRKPQTAVVGAVQPAQVACFSALLPTPPMGQSILGSQNFVLRWISREGASESQRQKEEEEERMVAHGWCGACECGRKLRAYGPRDPLWERSSGASLQGSSILLRASAQPSRGALDSVRSAPGSCRAGSLPLPGCPVAPEAAW